MRELTEKQRTVLRRLVSQGRIKPAGDRSTFNLLRRLEKAGLAKENLGVPYGYSAVRYGFSPTDAGRALLAEEKRDA